jgi:hypothetical protein
MQAHKMQQWLILQHAGFLQWPIRLNVFNSIKRLQLSYAVFFSLSLYFI